MPYLDDIWFVGGARVEGVHAEYGAWHMAIPNLHDLCKKLSRAFLRNCMPPLMIFGMWVGLAPKVFLGAKFWAWYMLVHWDCLGQKC